MDERLERHLCNLHNEVFEAAESRINTECSLTIREGISGYLLTTDAGRQFPHYTWGYIVTQWQSNFMTNVPSLYVRVYRCLVFYSFWIYCSLTIREGISELSADERLFISFPHYTWGYITKKTTKARSSKVPSLYVRVYLSLHCTAHKRWSSLTIREGISVCLLFLVPCPVFPHYTWGYIVRSRYDAGLFQVPSLYVRVYRREKSWM